MWLSFVAGTVVVKVERVRFAEFHFELLESPPFRQRDEDRFRPAIAPDDDGRSRFGDVADRESQRVAEFCNADLKFIRRHKVMRHRGIQILYRKESLPNPATVPRGID